jgi:hypothetical protein
MLFRNASALQQPEHFVATPGRRKKKVLGKTPEAAVANVVHNTFCFGQD